MGFIGKVKISPSPTNTETVVFRPWDTQFFGVRIGEARWEYASDEAWKKLKKIEEEAQKKNIRCLYLFCDRQDRDLPLSFRPEEGKCVEKRIFYVADVAGWDTKIPHAVPSRLVREKDIPALRQIAQGFVSTSRFLKDGRFSQELCQKYYATFVDKEFRDNGRRFWVAETKGKPVGFITAQEESVGEGRIVLIAVAPEMQQRGVGRALVARVFQWAQKEGLRRISVRTQQDNAASRALYGRAGFREAKQQWIYHRWL